MKQNFRNDQHLSINLRNKNYSMTIEGKGQPCFTIGISSLFQRTLSHNFKQSFQIYYSDLYWSKNNESENSLTIQEIIADIEEITKQLSLTSFILLAHSAFGIVALEYAKKYSDKLKGMILIGTPINSNQEIAKQIALFFEENAGPDRKRVDSERRTKFNNLNLSPLEPEEKFLQEYILRDAARYWHDPTFDCTFLWQNINLNIKLIDHFFTATLPKINAQINLHKIKCPIFLAAGANDYDCCPWMWANISDPPSKLTLSIFEKSGHYPHFEESHLFDERIAQWIKSIS